MTSYGATLQRTLALATPTVGSLAASSAVALRRIYLLEFTIGSEAAPASLANLWQWARFTAPGTSTAVTPQALDPADPAALTVAGQNQTVEPTYTAGAILYSVPLNQQATYRWLCAPGSELIGPATNNNGLGLKTPTIGSIGAAVTASVIFRE